MEKQRERNGLCAKTESLLKRNILTDPLPEKNGLLGIENGRNKRSSMDPRDKIFAFIFSSFILLILLSFLMILTGCIGWQ
tara:strand:- start:3888 stop:4127 length:240 start_codon:yes stop_codon:yes gene_type:complete